MLVALGLTILAGWLRWEFVAHAGGLWRDEVNTVNMACEASWDGFRQATYYDSFALLWQGVVRLWAAVGFCAEDRAWRALGGIIGWGQLLGLWVAGRTLPAHAPVWGVLLFGLGPAAASFGSTMRGYGLAALLAMIVFAAVVRFLREPTRNHWTLLAMASVFAVQTYLPNGVVVVALHAAAGLEFARRGCWRGLAAMAGASTLAAVSLVLNFPWIRYALEVGRIEQRPVRWAEVFDQWSGAVAADVFLLRWAWLAALCPLLLFPLAVWRKSRTDGLGDGTFFLAAAVLTGAGYAFYVHSVAQLPGLPWYFLAPTAVVALCVDGSWSQAARRQSVLRWLSPALCAVFGLAVFPSARAAVQFRMTNVDELASFVSHAASQRDFILVSPWYVGITFQRYYQGTAPWQTIPPLREHRYHVHPEIRERMREGEHAIRPLLDKAEAVLRNGGTVWLVGIPQLPAEGEAMPALPNALGVRTPAGPYLHFWETRVAVFLFERSVRMERVPVGLTVPVSLHESLGLLRLQGWRD